MMTGSTRERADRLAAEARWDPVRAAVDTAAAVDLSREIDEDGTFPSQAVALLHANGLLDWPFALFRDGRCGDIEALRLVLTTIGRGGLAVGRLYEGHVNAVALVARYGSRDNLALLRDEVRQGRAGGVWMAGPPLTLGSDGVLRGRKLLCSGAGHWLRPLVAADRDGGSILLLPRLDAETPVDIAGWTSHGMRATATGTVDFTGLRIGADEIVGAPGDYLRSPWFRGGAWRVIAVQLGGIEALMEHYQAQLRDSPHADHPIQLARYGEALIASETARLWVEKASRVAESPGDPEVIDAFVDLARNAFEGAALRVLALAQKAIGLNAFLRPNPIERVARDLTTYLRQPALDASLMSAAAFHLARPTAP